jgi:hypothetical protein
MKVSIFTAADYVDSSNGRLTIVNAFDNIEADTLPIIFKPFGIAIKAICEIKDRGKIYKGEIVFKRILSEKFIFKVPIMIKFPSGPHKKIWSVVSGINVIGIKLDSFGKYVLELKIRGKIISAIKLRVIHKVSVNETVKTTKKKG